MELLACCLPSLSTFAGAVCGTGAYIIRKRQMKKQKPKNQSRYFSLGNKFGNKSIGTYLVKAFRTRKSLSFQKRILKFCKNNAAARSSPAKLGNQRHVHWRDDEPGIVELHLNKDVSFQDALSIWKQEQAEKVAEGSYGEVYTFPHIDGSRRILKLIPVDNQHPLEESPNLSLILALTEIVCSVTLSNLQEGYKLAACNFPTVYRVCIVKDRYPTRLIKTWLCYKRKSEGTLNPTQFPQPDLYRENQRFATIEASYCGNPLSRQFKTLQNVWLAASIMTQLVAALAIAEEACEFEHRDLHLENILIKETVASKLTYSLHDLNFSVLTAGHQVFIIDFSFSRIRDGSKIYSLPVIASSTSPAEDWLDYKHIYEKMVDILKGDYEQFNPKTNILWCKFVIENIIRCLYQTESTLRNLVASPSVGHQMAAMRMLRKWNDSILNYNSCKDFLKDVVIFENSLVEFFILPHQTA